MGIVSFSSYSEHILLIAQAAHTTIQIVRRASEQTPTTMVITLTVFSPEHTHTGKEDGFRVGCPCAGTLYHILCHIVKGYRGVVDIRNLKNARTHLVFMSYCGIMVSWRRR